MVTPEKAAPVTGATWDYGPCAGGLSAVNRHRYAVASPDKLGTEPMAVDGIIGRRRGKRDVSRE